MFARTESSHRHTSRFASAFAFTCALAALALLPAGASAADGVVSASAGNGDQALEYWTPRRMRQAEPLTGPSSVDGAEEPSVSGARVNRISWTRQKIANPAAWPYRTSGTVFLRLGGGSYSCSGTAVDSNTRSVVATAAHCVYALGLGWAKDLVFVPGYDGSRPYGTWAARKLYAAKAYQRNEDPTVDFATVAIKRRNGKALQRTIGARGIAFNKKDVFVRSYGYPADGYKAGFDGTNLFVCSSGFGGLDSLVSFFTGPLTKWIGCDMTGGSSGGGWIWGEDVGAGKPGKLVGVNSYGYDGEPNRMYGPQLKAKARKLWVGAQRSCKGRRATIVGTQRGERLLGTKGADVFDARGGNDKLIGKGGKDRLCGGPGRDVLKGGGGNDILNGGPGKDRCNGGPGKDRASGCEKKRSV